MNSFENTSVESCLYCQCFGNQPQMIWYFASSHVYLKVLNCFWFTSSITYSFYEMYLFVCLIMIIMDYIVSSIIFTVLILRKLVSSISPEPKAALGVQYR